MNLINFNVNLFIVRVAVHGDDDALISTRAPLADSGSPARLSIRLLLLEPVLVADLDGLEVVDLVRFEVLAEVIAAHEPLGAAGAREALLAGVRLQMALQLVGAREALAAEHPRAGERALAGVPAQVRLQVRRLAVYLGAAGHVADVLAPAADKRAGRRRIEAVRTAAAFAAARRHLKWQLRRRERSGYEVRYSKATDDDGRR